VHFLGETMAIFGQQGGTVSYLGRNGLD
jgi:hypothetical protein